jgi:hypothetical protein
MVACRPVVSTVLAHCRIGRDQPSESHSPRSQSEPTRIHRAVYICTAVRGSHVAFITVGQYCQRLDLKSLTMTVIGLKDARC